MVCQGIGEASTREWKGLAGRLAFVNQALARNSPPGKATRSSCECASPARLGLDAAISPRNEDTVALRLKVGAILPPAMLGDFSLTAQPAPPANLFLPLRIPLQQSRRPGDRTPTLLCQPHGANVGWQRSRSRPTGCSPAAQQRTGPCVVAGRCGLVCPAPSSSRPSATGGEYIRPFVEVTSSRIFLEPSVIAAALKPRTVLLTNRPAFEARPPERRRLRPACHQRRARPHLPGQPNPRG